MESLSIYIRLRVRRGLSENVVTKIFGTCLPGHHNLGVHCRSTHLFIDVLARHDLPPPPCVVFIEFPQVLLDGSTWRSEPPQPSNSSTNQTIFRATHIYQLFVGSLRGSNMWNWWHIHTLLSHKTIMINSIPHFFWHIPFPWSEKTSFISPERPFLRVFIYQRERDETIENSIIICVYHYHYQNPNDFHLTTINYSNVVM